MVPPRWKDPLTLPAGMSRLSYIALDTVGCLRNVSDLPIGKGSTCLRNGVMIHSCKTTDSCTLLRGDQLGWGHCTNLKDQPHSKQRLQTLQTPTRYPPKSCILAMYNIHMVGWQNYLKYAREIKHIKPEFQTCILSLSICCLYINMDIEPLNLYIEPGY